MAAVLYAPYLRDLFRFAPLDAADLLWCAPAAALAWFELWKRYSAWRAVPRGL